MSGLTSIMMPAAVSLPSRYIPYTYILPSESRQQNTALTSLPLASRYAGRGRPKSNRVGGEAGYVQDRAVLGTAWAKGHRDGGVRTRA